MTKYARLSDVKFSDDAPEQTPDTGNAFTQGLRAGATRFGADLRGLAAGVGAAVGADQFAANQYAAAKEAHDRAAAQGPEVTSVGQVLDAPTFSEGLRRAGNYAGGVIGGVVPSMALGLGATVLTRGKAPLLTNTAAFAPQMIGSELNRQQEDPVASQASPGERLINASIAGTAEAAAMGAVPAHFGGKLLGQAEKEGIRAFGPSVMHNTGEAVLGNAAASAASEKIHQTAADQLNPNRDTANDTRDMLEAAASGAVGGLPFAAVGVAGDAIHRPGLVSGVRDKIGGMVDAAGEMVGKGKEKAGIALERVPTFDDLFSRPEKSADDALAERLSTEGDTLTPEQREQFAQMDPEVAQAKLAEHDKTMTQKLKGWATELMQDKSLSEESRAEIAAMGDDFMNKANAAKLAALKTARDGVQRATQTVKDLADSIGSKEAAEGDVKKSEYGSEGVRRAITETVLPFLEQHNPELLQSERGMAELGSALHSVLTKAQSGEKLPAKAVEKLQTIFGGAASRVMEALHKELTPDDNNVMAEINRLHEGEFNTKEKVALLSKHLTEAETENLKPADLARHAKAIESHVDGSIYANMGPDQRALEQRKFQERMQEYYGDNAQKVIDEFAKRAETKRGTLDEDKLSDAERAQEEAESGELSEGNPNSGMRERDGSVFEPAQEHTYRDGRLIESSDLSGKLYGHDEASSVAGRMMREVSGANPDRNVNFVKASDLPEDHPAVVKTREHLAAKLEKDRAAHEAKYESEVAARADALYRKMVEQSERNVNNGKALSEAKQAELRAEAERVARGMMPKEEFQAGPEHDISNYGLIEASGMKQEGRLTADELEAMRAKSTYELGSESRIDTGKRGVTLDAKKIVRQMYNKIDKISGETDLQGIARAFHEGIAAVQDHIGKSFEIPEKTVVAERNGEKITAGELVKELLPKEKEEFAWDEKDPVAARKAKMRAMRDQEMSAIEKSLRDRLDARVQDYVDSLKENRIKFDSESLRRFIREDEDAAKLKEALKLINGEWYRRAEEGERSDRETARDRLLQRGKTDESSSFERAMDGRYEVDPHGQIHIAAAGLGEQGVQRRQDYSDQNLSYARKKDKGTPDAIYAAFNKKVNEIEQLPSPAAKQLAMRLRELDAISEYMDTIDRNVLHIELTRKQPSELKPRIDKLWHKYKDQMTEQPEPSVWEGRSAKKPEALDESKVAGGEAAAQDAYNAQRVNQSRRASAQEQVDTLTHIQDVLGPDVHAMFAPLLHAGEYNRTNGKDFIRLSIHALDPMGTAFHESLHAFMQHMRDYGTEKVNHVLFRAADSMPVRRQLEKLLANEPDALKQIASSSEERAAYMYQFWKQGMLNVGEQTKGVFEKIRDAIYKALGMITNDERAVYIMDYFSSGEYAKNGLGDRNAVSRALLDHGTNKTFETIKQKLEPLHRLGEQVAGAGDAVLRDMGIPAVAKIANLIISPTTGTNRDAGFITTQGAKYRSEMNDFIGKLPQGLKQEHLSDALEALQTNTTAKTAEGRLAVREVKALLQRARKDMVDAGVKIGDLGPDYFPVVWDTSYIASHTKEFKAMLEPYVRAGKISNADDVIKKLIAHNGNEFGIETPLPGMQFIKQRELSAIVNAADRAPFLNKDLFGTVASYMQQATRRSEWSKRFGAEGEVLGQLIAQAKAEGATDKQLEYVQKYIRGIDGTLGDDIDPGLRRAFGNMIVYQNLRLLPMAVFSMAVDPGGILVRGGTIRDAFNAFKRGISEIPRSFKDNPAKDDWYKLAETMGVIENNTLLHALGSSFSQGMVGDLGRKINDTFFRYNLVEQMNTSMRVAAMPAALSFIAKHADGTHSVHSKRWLAELGLKPGEVIVKDGRPLLHADEFKKEGFSDKEAAERAETMRAAVNKWVDGAILRPNAAHKPVWMNDPHFALIAHLKQFVYSFNETIIKRVMNEAKYGNYTPAYALASYVPVMIAADAVKGAIVTGGSQPSYQADWDVWDYISRGMQRAGLFGVGQFAVDTVENVKHGGTGIGALAGPTIEQLGDAVRTLGGRETPSSFALDSLPANILAKGLLRAPVKGEPTFND